MNATMGEQAEESMLMRALVGILVLLLEGTSSTHGASQKTSAFQKLSTCGKGEVTVDAGGTGLAEQRVDERPLVVFFGFGDQVGAIILGGEEDLFLGDAILQVEITTASLASSSLARVPGVPH